MIRLWTATCPIWRFWPRRAGHGPESCLSESVHYSSVQPLFECVPPPGWSFYLILPWYYLFLGLCRPERPTRSRIATVFQQDSAVDYQNHRYPSVTWNLIFQHITLQKWCGQSGIQYSVNSIYGRVPSNGFEIALDVGVNNNNPKFGRALANIPCVS